MVESIVNIYSWKEFSWRRHDYDVEFMDIEALKKYMEEVERESREYLGKLTRKDLDKIFSGVQVPVRIEDVLMHVVEEEIHHRGELLCLMWQNDIEPPLKDWFNWLSETHVTTKE